MTESTPLLDGDPYCPRCDRWFDETHGLSIHWARYCEHPPLVDEQHHVIQGLLLGGASLDSGSANPSVVATTRFRELAVWTADQLGWLTASVRRVPVEPDAGDGTHTYKVTTRSHPGLERYEQWRGRSGDGVTPPVASIATPRRTIRVWYAHSAFVRWNSSHNSRETGFSAKGDERREWVRDLLERLGYDPSYRTNAWYLSASETRDLLQWWVGGPVAGVAHKWAMRRDEYDQLRDDAEAGRDRPADSERNDIDITLYAPGEFAPSEASIPEWEPERGLHQQFSDGDCLDALRMAAGLAGIDLLDLTIDEYERQRREMGTVPGKTLISDRFDGWTAAKRAASDRSS